MATLVIKTNPLHGSVVSINDLGFDIPASGGSETFTDEAAILMIRDSRDLRALATDDLYGAGSSTLILNDGTSDVAQANVSNFLTVAMFERVGAYSMPLRDGEGGETVTTSRQPCRVATTANVTLSGGAPDTLDGVSLAVDDRILVTYQTTGSENGIYMVQTLGTGANGTWVRSLDADESAEVVSAMTIAVSEGDIYGGSQWMLTTPAPITLDTTSLTFARMGMGEGTTRSVRLTTVIALAANTAAGSGIGKTLTADANGALSVDSVAVAVDDLVLVKDEATSADNGIYTVTQTGDAGTPYILTRAGFYDEDHEVTPGSLITVSEGAANSDTLWQLAVDGPIIVDTTALAYTTFSNTDVDAIHDNVAAEISALTEKSIPVAGDHLLIEDSEAADGKKRLQVGTLFKSLLPVLKETAGTINPGQAVYLTNYDTGNMIHDVELAQADTAATMPAIGVALTTITNAASGLVLMAGEIVNIDTSAFATGDEVFISATTAGGLTATKPTGTNLIQKIGQVGRTHASLGTLIVNGAGRVNDIPNVASHDIDWNNNDNTGFKTATFDAEYDNGNSGASITIDWNNGQFQRITLTASAALTFTAPADGVGRFQMKFIQDGTGGWDPTFPVSVLWAGASGAPNFTNQAGSIDIVTFYWDGTNYFAVEALNFG